LLYLNEGNGKFLNVATDVGIDPSGSDHSLGVVFTDVNGDGRPDLYVANDLDPNRLYTNIKGGHFGFHFVEEAHTWAVDDPNAGMGVAVQGTYGNGSRQLFVTNSRGQGHAAFQLGEYPPFVNIARLFVRAIGKGGTGWGDSWIDLANNGRLDLVLDNGDIPVTSLKKDVGPIQVLENRRDGTYADASKIVGLDPGPLVNGRGLAAADYDNDGRVDIAVGSIGGKLILLHNTGAKGHWLDVAVKEFSPGAVVTAILPNGTRQVREIQYGSSYLSSEDPRVHFGLGRSTSVRELVVRFPNGGGSTILKDVKADQIVTVSRRG
jgi:enediyne biosynthesis protein E4